MGKATNRRKRMIFGLLIMTPFVVALLSLHMPVWLRVLSGVAGIGIWWRFLWRHMGLRDETLSATRSALARSTMSDSPLLVRIEIKHAYRRGDVEYLIAALVDPQWQTLTLKLLGRLGDPTAIKPVQGLLRAGRWNVRMRAALALGELGATCAVADLEDLVRGRDELYVRACAARALGQIGSSSSVDLLIEVVNEPGHDVRFAAARALAVLGDRRALEPLRSAKAQEPRRSDRQVFSRAIHMLEKPDMRAP